MAVRAITSARGRSAGVLSASALCLALLGAVPAAAATVWRGTTLNAFGYGPDIARKDLDLNRQAGANAVRIDISWAQLEPSRKGQFSSAYVAQVDDYLNQAASRGLKVIAVVQSTPCWASSAPASQRCSGVSIYPPLRSSDYADAAAYIARRWASKLAALEVWNEPNNSDFWHSSAPARDYAHLLEAAYPAIKSAAPQLSVLGGALLWSDRAFLDELYANGIHGFFDGISIHPYDPPTGAKYGPKYTFAQGVPWVHDDMVAHDDADKPLWLTEFGWPTCPTSLFWWCVSETEQASRLTNAFNAAAAWPYIGAEIVYTLRDPGTDANNWQDHMGLLNFDYSTKPAWDAFTSALAAPPPGPSGGDSSSTSAASTAQNPTTADALRAFPRRRVARSGHHPCPASRRSPPRPAVAHLPRPQPLSLTHPHSPPDPQA